MLDTPKHLPQADDEVIDLKTLIGTILNAKWFILGTMLIFVIVGGIYCALRTPMYQTNSLISVSNKSSNALESSVLANAAMFGGFSRTDPVSTESQILKSRAVLSPVIQQLHLDLSITPLYFPGIGGHMARSFETLHPNQVAPARFGFSRYNWGGAKLTVNHFEVPADLQDHPFTLTAGKLGAYTVSFQGKILGTGHVGIPLIRVLHNGHLLSLTVASLKANPGTQFMLVKAREMNTLTALGHMIKIQQVNKMASLLSLSLEGENPTQIAEVLDALDNSAQNESIHQKSEQAAKTLSFLKAQIPAVENKLILAESALNAYRASSGNIDITAQGTAMLQGLSSLQSQITTLRVQRQSLESQYTNKSYEIQSLTTQIQALETQKQKLIAQTKTLPSADQTLMQLTRNVTVQNAVYTKLLGNLQQFELLKEGTIGDVQIIDDAFVPYQNINKPASMLLTLFALLGALLSIMGVFVRQYLFRGIEDPEIIENKYGLPVFGTMHQCKAQYKQLQKFARGSVKHLSVLEELDSHDVTVESFRSLRTNLIFELAKTDNNVIAISGPIPNVGKSFVSVNAAVALAEANKRVLLIDGDIRKGDIYQYFKDVRYPGLCDLLAGTAKVDECIHHTRIQNLDFIPTGRLPKRHTQVLMSKNFEDILAFLKQQYDVVIIDTAPVLAVTDACIIGKLAGVRLLVMAYGMHDEKELQLTQARYEKAGLDITGCVFNLIKLSNSALSNRYQYAYRYSSKRSQAEAALQEQQDSTPEKS